MTSRWFSTKRHTRLIYYELKWIIPATLELNCWECCWVFEVFVELWPESLAFSVLITNSPLTGVPRGKRSRRVHYKHYSIGTAGTNGYLWESKYHWTTFGHDHRNSLFEGLTIDLTQPFISHWIRPVRGPILMILLYDLSPYPPYPEIPWLFVDLKRAQGICYLKCEHPKTHASQNMSCDH